MIWHTHRLQLVPARYLLIPRLRFVLRKDGVQSPPILNTVRNHSGIPEISLYIRFNIRDTRLDRRGLFSEDIIEEFDTLPPVEGDHFSGRQPFCARESE